MGTDSKPNMVFLFADQHHADVLSCAGHADVSTPNLDRLAARGVRFNRAYCQDAICGPSRMSMMTGLYPRTLGVMTNGEGTSVVEGAVPIAAHLQQQGYETMAVGKRHLTNGPSTCDFGWDAVHSTDFWCRQEGVYDYIDWINEAGLADQLAADFGAEKGRALPGLRTTEGLEFPRKPFTFDISALPADRTMEAYCAQQTIDFLRSDRAQEKPFFIYCGFYRPHQPYTPLQRFYDDYRSDEWGDGRRSGSGLKKPGSLEEPAENLPPLLRHMRENGQPCWRLELARDDHQWYRDYIAAYYALVAEIDDYVGQILDALEQQGVIDNTIIVYSSDHGDFIGHHGMAEKCAPGHNVYEDTLRVPLLISYPGVLPAGEVREDLVELVDLYPTLLELAEIDQPQQPIELQGLPLGSYLRNGQSVPRTVTVSENWSQTTIISANYKYARMNDPKPHDNRDFREFGDMFFERSTDSLEVTNRIDDHGLIEQREFLKQALATWESTTRQDGMLERRSGSES